MPKINKGSNIINSIFNIQSYFADFCEKHYKTLDVVFTLLFAVTYTYNFFITTMFQEIMSDSVMAVLFNVSRVCTLGGVLFAIIAIASTRDRRKLFIEGLIFLFLMLFYVKGSYHEVFTVLIFALAAGNRSGRKLVWTTAIIGTIGMIASHRASMMGIIRYLTYANDTKHAFGIVYHTDAAAHILNLMLAYCFLKPKKGDFWLTVDFIVIGFGLFINYRYIGARANLIMMILLLAGTMIFDIVRDLNLEKIKPLARVNHVLHTIIGSSLGLFLTLACFVGTQNYTEDGELPLESIISKAMDLNTFKLRLKYGNQALAEHPYFSIFGHFIDEQGAGGIVDSSKPYYFLDSSYIRIPILYGTGILIIFLGLVTYYQIKNIRKREYYRIFLVSVAMLSGIMEHHLIDFSYVFILYLVFARDNDKSDENSENNKVSKAKQKPNEISPAGSSNESLLLMDVSSYIVAFASGMIMRYGLKNVWTVLWDFRYGENIRTLLLTVALYFFIYIFLSYASKYELGKDALSQILIVLRNHLFLATVAMFMIFIGQQGSIISRRLVFYIFFLSILLDEVCREIYRSYLERKLAKYPQFTQMVYTGANGRVRCPAVTINEKIVRILSGDTIPGSEKDLSKYKHVFAIGSKGIPADYGGFETFMENLTLRHESDEIMYHVARISADSLRYEYNGAACFDLAIPDIGNAKAIYYDCLALKNCINYCKRNPEIKEPVFFIMACRIGPFIAHYRRQIHALGGKLYINPDGHEWKRAKWSRWVRAYWHFSEKLMVKNADFLICDSKGIEEYIKHDYAAYDPKTTFIAYGSDLVSEKDLTSDEKMLEEYRKWLEYNEIRPNEYYLIVGRFVPENNFRTMIKEFMASESTKDLVIITTENEGLMNELEAEFDFMADPRVKFVGTVYNAPLLQMIRINAFAYLHGHSVGGTNPSLLEALGSTKLNLLFDVNFNTEVGGNGAFYWSLEEGSLKSLIERVEKLTNAEIEEMGVKAKKRIEEEYLWSHIVKKYEEVFLRKNEI